MLDYLRRLFAYDDWANQEVLNALNAGGERPPKSLKWMAHIVAAERLWLERLQSQKQTVPVWPEFTWQQCRDQAVDLARSWREYVASLSASDLDRTVAYTNSKGERYNSKVVDILTHVVTHSAHHRGQIAADMRAAGLTPAYTDFIQGVRQGNVK
jgi:uncharacterized damage-inducible protein DinB